MSNGTIMEYSNRHAQVFPFIFYTIHINTRDEFIVDLNHIDHESPISQWDHDQLSAAVATLLSTTQ